MFPDLTRDDVFRLETRRLWLRWPRGADGQAVARLAGVKEVAEMTASIPHPYPPHGADAFILGARRSNAEGSALDLLITPKSRPDQVMGGVGIRVGSCGSNLGYWLGQPYQGEGYATEAAQALIDAFFTLTPASDLSACTRVVNPASRRVLEKCGFQHEGAGFADFPARGGRLPVDRFRLDRKTWASLKSWSRGGMFVEDPALHEPVPLPMAAE